ncbi:HNH endonuclease [uncultured Bradyrhizobium sp.]|uniref:HNH endonuclease n=1 Tax=uncultured Bradyrhizobium sp. TaxID=199684 RepID=UPI002636EE76|nr:HNH endonuclease [uncultured Bradyrhizobium sp.]
MSGTNIAETRLFCYESGVTERVNALPPLTIISLSERQMANPKLHPESVARKSLTPERLRGLLHYDPETGLFTWRVPRKGTGGMGSTAGRVNPGNGYVDICVDYRRYLAHRLAWLYMTGGWPKNDVDHRDRVRTNNAWSNLRAATRSQNLANASKPKDGATPFKGVQKNGKGWQAVITVRGVRKCLGTYVTPEKASDAYRRAALEMNGEFAA